MEEEKIDKSALFKKALTFQLKLLLDATRDVILSPAGIFCALIDIVTDKTPSQSYYNRLMTFGHSTDKWLNLFGEKANSASSTNQKEISTDITKISKGSF